MQTRASLPILAFQPECPPIIASKKLQHINCIIQPSTHSGGLFLGDVICIIKEEILPLFNIKAIITCMNHQQRKPQFHHLMHLVIDSHDTLQQKIIQHFDRVFQFIQEARNQGKNVLVHCHAGVSRSAAIVCAYLIKLNKWTPQQSLSYIQTKRERARPNANFWAQLQAYYKQFSYSQPNTNFSSLNVSRTVGKENRQQLPKANTQTVVMHPQPFQQCGNVAPQWSRKRGQSRKIFFQSEPHFKQLKGQKLSLSKDQIGGESHLRSFKTIKPDNPKAFQKFMDKCRSDVSNSNQLTITGNKKGLNKLQSYSSIQMQTSTEPPLQCNFLSILGIQSNQVKKKSGARIFNPSKSSKNKDSIYRL